MYSVTDEVKSPAGPAAHALRCGVSFARAPPDKRARRTQSLDKLMNPHPDVYGSWARDNYDCLQKSVVTMPAVKVVQLMMAVVSACQVLFMISRAPRVPWEAMYLPGTEAVSYSMSFFSQGYILLANGKTLPWCRMAAWLCTCPIMLGMVSNMALIKYKSQPLNPIMVAAAIIRTVFGISATMAENESVIWVHAFFSFLCFGFEMVCAYAIFSITIQDFKDIKSPLADRVVARLQILRAIFFITWNMYWILWIVSSTYKCWIDENANSILHLLGDLSCKNTYGIFLWATTWGLLNGKWDREFARNRDENGVLMDVDPAKAAPVEPPKENFDVKVFGTTIASVRRSQRRPPETDLARRRTDRTDRDRDRDRNDGRRRFDSDRSSDDYYEHRREPRDYDRDYRTRRGDQSTSPERLPTKNMSTPMSEDTMVQLLELLQRNTETQRNADTGADHKGNAMC